MKHRDAYNALLRASFPFFLQTVFETLNPSTEFKDNWHIDAMCHHLDEVRHGRCRRLLITIPPRYMKSITVSIAYPAWVLGHDPTKRFLVASYASRLVLDISRFFRSIVESTWYRSAFPAMATPARNADGDFVTHRGGGLKAVTVGGATTGFGADYIIVDDILNGSDASSAAAREAALDYYRGSLISRLNDQTTGRIIVIGQRLHEADLPGHCIETGLFTHLNLPIIAQQRQEIPIGQGRTHIREVGDLLSPLYQPQAEVERLRQESGVTFFSTQFLQDPTPADSNYISWDRIQRYDEAPPRERLQKVVQSWDTAMSPEATSDWSVCTTWGFFDDAWGLLDLVRFRSTYTDLLDRVRAERRRWRPDLLIVERCATGIPLIDDLTNEIRTRPRCQEAVECKIVRYQPKIGKTERLIAQLAKLESGRALFPKDAPWLETLRKEMTAFPNGRHDDQVDSISQFLDWTGWGRSAIALHDRGGIRAPGVARPVVGSRRR